MPKLETGKSNKVVKSRARFKYQPPFVDPHADMTTLRAFTQFSSQQLIYFSRTSQILNCLNSILKIIELRIRMKFFIVHSIILTLGKTSLRLLSVGQFFQDRFVAMSAK